MNNQQPTRQQRLEREKQLHLYMDAFERGDYDRMTQILNKAEQDPELGDLIWEVHAAYVVEQESEKREHDVEVVRHLLRTSIPSAWGASEEEEIPPLTVGDVIARMQADEATRGLTSREFTRVAQQLSRSSQLLPADLGLHGCVNSLPGSVCRRVNNYKNFSARPHFFSLQAESREWPGWLQRGSKPNTSDYPIHLNRTNNWKRSK